MKWVNGVGIPILSYYKIVYIVSVNVMQLALAADSGVVAVTVDYAVGGLSGVLVGPGVVGVVSVL